MKIELIYKPVDKKKLNEQDNESQDDDEGDDASTVVLDEDDIAELLSVEPEKVDDAGATPKLNPIVEEARVNEDAEENYDGAAGLWAQDYQLPCFNAHPKSNSTYQRSANYDIFDRIPAVPAPQPVTSFQCQMPSKPTTLDFLKKALDEPIVFTKEKADCGICMRAIDIGRGVVLKDCLHTFCRRCLIQEIEHSETAVVKCPAKNVRCVGEVRDEEIRELLSPDAYVNYTREMLYKMNIRDTAELFYEYEFVENNNEFHCLICMNDYKPGDGVVLKDCLHIYCKLCLGQYIETAEQAVVRCPFRDDDGWRCIGVLMDTEVRSMVSEDAYRRHIGKSLTEAEASIANTFHCKTPDCPVWIEIDEMLDGFECPGCKKTNCVKCKAVHQGISCETYEDMLHGGDRRARENAATELQVRGLIASKTTQSCPKCGILVQRIEGCRHMTCSQCKHEFQWTGIDLQ